MTIDVDVAISGDLTDSSSDFFLQPQARAEGFKTAQVLFYFDGRIAVVDSFPDVLGFIFGFDPPWPLWTPSGTYRTFRIEVDPCSGFQCHDGANAGLPCTRDSDCPGGLCRGHIDYYYGGTLLWRGNIFAGRTVDQFLVYSDNFPVGFADFDNLVITTGASCDCDNNLVADVIDIANGFDCNGNQVVDRCDIAACTGDPACADCNTNGIPDECEGVYVCGACCRTTGTCIVEGPASCTAANGVYLGDGTTCAGANCECPADGFIEAWGSNGYGQSSVPAPNSGFVAVAAGYIHSLGLMADGSIVAWGDNSHGQINVPTPNMDFIAFGAGWYHSLGHKADGSIVGWGYNAHGQIDVPAPNTDFVAVAAGGYHSLGLKADGSIVAWGWSDHGQLNVPAPNTAFSAVAAGGYHSLGLKSDGSIVGWGRNDYGQTNVPAPNTGFIAVAGGDLHSLGLKSDGSIVVWGYNGEGQTSVPAPNTSFIAVAAGNWHNLGLKIDGSIVAWGWNLYGQNNVPAPNTGFVGVAGGYAHSLGLNGDSDCQLIICGNGVVEGLEQCDDGNLSNGDGCSSSCQLEIVPPGNIVWDADDLSTERTTRSLRFTVDAPPPNATASPGQSAIKVTMVDLQHPNPRNLTQYPPPNYSTFDTGTHGTCGGATTSPNYNGHHCAADAECLGPNGAITTDDGTCSAGPACTAIGETNPPTANGIGGCARWVGRPSTFYETQGPPLFGPYRASRLQCTPFYWDWKSEELGGRVTVVGAEIVPSSAYSVQAYASTCMGVESECSDVSVPVTMYTRRWGDVDAEYSPPSTTNQPNAIDVAQLVNKFKNSAGAPDHYRAQVQANVPELNSSINALDIVAVVDATKSFAYSFTGPCPCPSPVMCGGSCTGCAGMCVKTCTGGDNDGEPCINNAHCPGGGACSAVGTCRDSCGRCTP